MNLIEKILKKSQVLLKVTEKLSIKEQIDVLKNSFMTNKITATLIHMYSKDWYWRSDLRKKLEETIDFRFSEVSNSGEYDEDVLVKKYIDGWLVEEFDWYQIEKPKVTGKVLTEGSLYLDPKEPRDIARVIDEITNKIETVFSLDKTKAYDMATYYIGHKININEYNTVDMSEVLDFKVGDKIRVIDVDVVTLPLGPFETRTMPDTFDKGEILKIYKDELESGDEYIAFEVYFPQLEFLTGVDNGIRILSYPYDTFIKVKEDLNESTTNNQQPKMNIPENVRGNLVMARFERKGGWGRHGDVFIVYATPMGLIVDINRSTSLNNRNIPFRVGQSISFGDLYRFEQSSEYDLQMKGRIRESIREQDEQQSLFPTGQWNFGHEVSKEDVEWVEEMVPERIIKPIFELWDTSGMNSSDLKLFGIVGNSSLINTYLLKRYIQYSKIPLPVKYVLNCNALSQLFYRYGDGYEYIEPYLCGTWLENDRWWFDSEWDEYIMDNVNEENTKRISNILGIPTSSVDNILNNQPQTEEEEQVMVTDESHGLVQDIRLIILNSYDQTQEDVTYRDIHNSIDNALAEHFQHMGRMVRKDGTVNWVIEDDLRNLVQNDDIWDNPNTFEHHTDYIGNTLEEAIDSFNPEYQTIDTIFEVLMDEEFLFYDDYGKQGDALELDTNVFSNYYYPSIDIHNFNEILSERLYEVDPVNH